jgi:hypothetical protein
MGAHSRDEGMRCPAEYGVKQYVAEIRSGTGIRFRVYTTGSDRHYMFDPIDEAGCSYCMGFPVEKARLRPELRRPGRGRVGKPPFGP